MSMTLSRTSGAMLPYLWPCIAPFSALLAVLTPLRPTELPVLSGRRCFGLPVKVSAPKNASVDLDQPLASVSSFTALFTASWVNLLLQNPTAMSTRALKTTATVALQQSQDWS